MSFPITFAKCIKFTFGELDREPSSQYLLSTVEAEMFTVGPDPMISEMEPSYEVEVDGRVVGCGDTMHDAIGDAMYRLMDESRTEAKERDRRRQEDIAHGAQVGR